MKDWIRWCWWWRASGGSEVAGVADAVLDRLGADPIVVLDFLFLCEPRLAEEKSINSDSEPGKFCVGRTSLADVVRSS